MSNLIKRSPFIKVRQETENKCSDITESVKPVIQYTVPQRKQFIPQPQQYVTECMSYDSQRGCFHNNPHKNVYISNGSIGKSVIELFVREIVNCALILDSFVQSKNLNEFVRLIALILTQSMKIIVKHERWLYVYNGKIYVLCSDDSMLVPIIRELCENGFTHLHDINCTSAITSSIIREVNEMALYVDETYDISQYIVFNDGILDLVTCTLEPFKPGLFFTSMVNADWHGKTPACNTFNSMLQLYTQGDEVLKNRIMEAMGLCLTNDTVKRIICFQGVTNSGKSMLVNFLMHLLNSESIVSMYPNEFGEKFALSKIFGKSLCVCMDMEASPLNSRATAVLKQISGNDMIGAEFKYANGNVMFRSKARVILCSNFDIVPSEYDAAFNMRKLVIPFTHQISNESIPYEVLMQNLEYEKNTIVRMLVSAYIHLKNRGYVFSGDSSWYDTYIPQNGAVISQDNSVRNFISDMCVITGNESDCTSAFDLFTGYQNYMSNYSCNYINNMNQFSQCIRKLYPEINHVRKRLNGGENAVSCFSGILIKQ